MWSSPSFDHKTDCLFGSESVYGRNLIWYAALFKREKRQCRPNDPVNLSILWTVWKWSARETLEIVKTAVEALRDKKAEDVTVIDITGVSSIADYFIIANGNNQNQLTAMQDAVYEALYKAGLHAKQIEGNNKSTWILMDYEDIIVHLFSKEDRLFYDLERIWRDGKIIEM